MTNPRTLATTFWGRADGLYCSPKCRQQAVRNRRKADSAIMPTLDRIAAQLSEIADFVKALDHDTKIKFLADHIDAFNEIGKQHRRTVAVLNAADRKRQKDAIAAKQKASTETDVAATMSAALKDKGVFQ